MSMGFKLQTIGLKKNNNNKRGRREARKERKSERKSDIHFTVPQRA